MRYQHQFTPNTPRGRMARQPRTSIPAKKPRVRRILVTSAENRAFLDEEFAESGSEGSFGSDFHKSDEDIIELSDVVIEAESSDDGDRAPTLSVAAVPRRSRTGTVLSWSDVRSSTPK